MSEGKTITMEYHRVIHQAEQLEQLAEELKNIHQEMQGAVEGASDSWKGDASNAYQKKGVRLSEKIKQDADQLAETAAAIRRIAEWMHKAELESMQLAERRTYQR